MSKAKDWSAMLKKKPSPFFLEMNKKVALRGLPTMKFEVSDAGNMIIEGMKESEISVKHALEFRDWLSEMFDE